LSGFSKWKDKLDRLTGVRDWTPHDLRRTQATVMPDLDVSETVVERIHNHTLPRGSVSTSMKAYNHYQYVRPMREALEKYATYVERKVRAEKSGRGSELSLTNASR
jgi:hypothetical protein